MEEVSKGEGNRWDFDLSAQRRGYSEAASKFRTLKQRNKNSKSMCNEVLSYLRDLEAKEVFYKQLENKLLLFPDPGPTRPTDIIWQNKNSYAVSECNPWSSWKLSVIMSNSN